MSSTVAEIFRQAARENRQDPRRKGNLIQLDDPAEMIISGDIHGHRGNLTKVIDCADLPHNPQRVLVVQEVIHGPPDPRTGQDRSVELLMRVARLKASCPNLLFLLGNHDVAQITGNEITKEGRGVCKAFTASVAQAFGADADEVGLAVLEFLRSLPIAIRVRDKLLITHSLPSPNRMELAGTAVLAATDYTDIDLRRGGGAYEWTWGRNQTPEQLDALAAQVGVEFFVMAHRHSGTGFELVPSRGICIASDNDRGCILQLPPDATVTFENVQTYLKQIITLKR